MNDMPEPYTERERVLRRNLGAARRVNAVSAVVADGHRHFLDHFARTVSADLDTMSEASLKALVAGLLNMVDSTLDDVVAALGGETDAARFRLHPDINQTHLASLAYLATAPLEDR